MAKTIDEGFEVFHKWLTPTVTESANAKSHRASIDACLKSNFGTMRFFRTGSFGNATSVSSYSDVDYFASIPREKLKQDSSKILAEVKSVLETRFPNTGVHIDAPAVVVPFGTDPSETTEIVPADFIRRENDCSIYEIPDKQGGWMRSSPELGKLYVDKINDRLGGDLKPLIRFLKAWKCYRGIPISSYYLEMFVGMYAAGESSIVYSIDIRNIFKKLQKEGLPVISDPIGIGGSITPCKLVDRQKVLEAIDRAVTRSTEAYDAEKAENISAAFDWWNKVYADLFPSYY